MFPFASRAARRWPSRLMARAVTRTVPVPASVCDVPHSARLFHWTSEPLLAKNSFFAIVAEGDSACDRQTCGSSSLWSDRRKRRWSREEDRPPPPGSERSDRLRWNDRCLPSSQGRRCGSRFPVVGFQTMTSSLSPPLITRRAGPAPANRTVKIRWPVVLGFVFPGVQHGARSRGSTGVSCRSACPLTRCLPSGLKATLAAKSSCPDRTRRSRPEATSHNRTEESPAVAGVLPSGLRTNEKISVVWPVWSIRAGVVAPLPSTGLTGSLTKPPDQGDGPSDCSHVCSLAFPMSHQPDHPGTLRAGEQESDLIAVEETYRNAT